MNVSAEHELVIERLDGIGVVRLNRPEKLNALSTAMMAELVEAFDAFDQDPEVRVVVLAAEGKRGFCAGRDLVEAGGSQSPRGERPMKGVQRNVFEAIYECCKPTVAAVFGYTLGGGAELALACDIRLAAVSLQFGLPEVTVGMGANFASVMLPRLLPMAIAMDLLYTGRRMRADEALRVGLVNAAVADDDLRDSALRYARSLCENAPLTQQRYKAMVTKGRDLPVQVALRLDASPSPYRSNDRIEGTAAWRERRKPIWTGT